MRNSPHFFKKGLGLGDGYILWHDEAFEELDQVGMESCWVVPQGGGDGLLILTEEGRNGPGQQVPIK